MPTSIAPAISPGFNHSQIAALEDAAPYTQLQAGFNGLRIPKGFSRITETSVFDVDRRFSFQEQLDDSHLEILMIACASRTGYKTSFPS